MTVGFMARAAAKTAVRRSLGRLGYELVPIGSSFVELQRSLLASCDLLVDVGANVGQYVDRSRAAGFQGRVVSFEPLTDAFAVLSRRSANNPDWDVRNVALGAREGGASLRVSANSVSSSLLDIRDEHVRAAPNSRVAGAQEVTVSTLDVQLRDDPARSVWLKIDVQGAELDVLGGAVETLDRVRVVQSELSLTPLYSGQSDYLEVCRHLRERGFRMCGVQPGFQDPRSGQLLQMDALFVRPDG